MGLAKRIYVIDDDEDDRMLLSQAIGEVIQGIDIREFEYAYNFYLEMPDIFSDNGSSMILLDMNMPKMSGLELLREIRRSPEARNIPVILISTSINQRMVSECQDLGIEAYLKKPDTTAGFTLVADTIQNCFEKHFQ
ncbi:response regulator [Dyadobacter luticola]|uniref:Response regulator n=1 Tax=Dyadobacter luticola TaxID=1979387 RepID=A0A5R9L542_9BACT|nr:response regulator [Dyadobacter luticola]TLV03511.1 response regulator [Dyadobacter luticola]